MTLVDTLLTASLATGWVLVGLRLARGGQGGDLQRGATVLLWPLAVLGRAQRWASAPGQPPGHDGGCNRDEQGDRDLPGRLSAQGPSVAR